MAISDPIQADPMPAPAPAPVSAPMPMPMPADAPAPVSAPAGAMDIVRIIAWAFVLTFVLIVGAFIFVIVRDGNNPLVSQAMDALIKIALGDGAVIVALIGGARFVDAMASRPTS